AHGNVAVRNIGQACLKYGFKNFRLIVSKEFYEEWHESQYEEMKDFVITSDQLYNQDKICEEFQKCSVIICTMAMLHNENFHKVVLHKRQPTMLIVDEASQIHIGAYIGPILQMKSLKKTIFIGDDKQLPPYGSEKIKIYSIFDIYHPTYFLEIQYRLPRAIGDFISENVYSGRLKNPEVATLSETPNHPILWVNVVGKEKLIGTSYQNEEEANQIVALAKKFIEKGRQFVILVPYDRQRHIISRKLKELKISPERIVFNIDSFQGQESDFVIVGMTRTERLGFLIDERRANVWLSRCKEAMIIVGHLGFFTSQKAKNTLLGKLARTCQRLDVVVHARRQDVTLPWLA
ncbi:P-loop containing nucleoside triphosphate hydrolase protein, partial [Paraphysoderma sedebokerense]